MTEGRTMVEVTQADRDFAAGLYLHLDTEVSAAEVAEAEAIRRGECDQIPPVQFIARHREAAEAASKAREAALVEALAIFDEPMSPRTGGERGDELACAVRTFLSRSGDSK